jgi:hypothetical protein
MLGAVGEKEWRGRDLKKVAGVESVEVSLNKGPRNGETEAGKYGFGSAVVGTHS